MRMKPSYFYLIFFVAAFLSSCASPTEVADVQPSSSPTDSVKLEPTSTVIRNPTSTVISEPVNTAMPESTNTAVAEPTNTAVPEPTITINEQSNSGANADVTFVRIVATGDDRYTFHVTVLHPDSGWEDYADGWDVVLPDGTVAKPRLDSPFTRLLAHPHVNEQPFTRSQTGVEISAEITQVTVRAHDLVAGFGGETVIIDMASTDGEGYTLER